MPNSRDWFPGTREGQLAMAANWIAVLGDDAQNGQGGAVKKSEAWGVPEAACGRLAELYRSAAEILAAAMKEETRTHVVNVACRAAFAELARAMRDMKKRRFFVPPLSEADLAALGLRLPDKTRALAGEPEGQIAADIFLTTGRCELGVKARFIKGSPGDKANKGFNYWYLTVAPGEKPPASPEELTKSFYTQRRSDVIPFEFSDSGKTAWIACRIENKRKKGRWGPMISALIP